MGWTDERVEMLKKLWQDGLSASQIAKQLGGVTRNAVIGKVHRLGLSGRSKTAPAAPAAPRPRKPSAPRPAAPAEEEPIVLRPEPIAPVMDAAVTAMPFLETRSVEIAIPTSQRVTIMDLRESMCRWPIGDPTNPEFRFCGGRSITGLPYCPEHAQVAYQPAADRRRDRKLLRA